MALAAIALSSCSTDELIEQNYGPEIQFSVVANKATRAQASTTTLQDDANGFKTMAYNATNGELFLSGNVKHTGGAWKVDNGGTTFWPQEKLNFYSVYPASTTLTKVQPEGEESKMQIQDYTVKATADEDLLYATNTDQSKDAPEVKVNFRHALSQIAFTAKNTNANLKVTVKEIRVVGINNQGTYTLTNASTEGNKTNKGSWDVATSTANYNVTIPAITGETTSVEFNGTTGSIKTTPALFLMPQELDTWTVTKDAEGKKYTATGSARIEVLCKIDQKTGVADNYSTLWPKTGTAEEYAWVAIPLTGEAGATADAATLWKEGTRYIYNIVFGEGAGYDPGVDPENPVDPKPVLVPISFNITVDDFVAMTPENGFDIPEENK